MEVPLGGLVGVSADLLSMSLSVADNGLLAKASLALVTPREVLLPSSSLFSSLSFLTKFSLFLKLSTPIFEWTFLDRLRLAMDELLSVLAVMFLWREEQLVLRKLEIQ